ncbi:MAG: Proteasome subunit alpha type-2, partial [Paramarteilia canceri]
GVRPFGTSLLIAGYQKSTNECCIYQCDPAGTYFAWNAVEIGENSDAYLKTLEQIYLNEMTVEEAIETALKVLNDKSSYTISAKSVDIAIVDNNGVDILSEEDKDVYIRQI